MRSGIANAISLAQPYINNPDLAERIMNNWPLSDTQINFRTVYGDSLPL